MILCIKVKPESNENIKQNLITMPNREMNPGRPVLILNRLQNQSLYLLIIFSKQGFQALIICLDHLKKSAGINPSKFGFFCNQKTVFLLWQLLVLVWPVRLEFIQSFLALQFNNPLNDLLLFMYYLK